MLFYECEYNFPHKFRILSKITVILIIIIIIISCSVKSLLVYIVDTTVYITDLWPVLGPSNPPRPRISVADVGEHATLSMELYPSDDQCGPIE